jgi:hypothetical protein
MKRLIYVLPLLLALASGCLKESSNYSYNLPASAPSGTFSGEFRRVSSNADNAIVTLKTNIKLVIGPATDYSVQGDTTIIHAGSKGSYSISGDMIKFVDSTLPKTGTPTKNHLDGEYLFVYNGSIFQMKKNVGDTLNLQYDLKRTN